MSPWWLGRCEGGGGCQCGCGGHHSGFGMGFGRHFISKDEIISHLEEYLNQLKAEMKGVEERIAELKKQEE